MKVYKAESFLEMLDNMNNQLKDQKLKELNQLKVSSTINKILGVLNQ